MDCNGEAVTTRHSGWLGRCCAECRIRRGGGYNVSNAKKIYDLIYRYPEAMNLWILKGSTKMTVMDINAERGRVSNNMARQD